jgi:hypothetical protein
MNDKKTKQNLGAGKEHERGVRQSMIRLYLAKSTEEQCG